MAFYKGPPHCTPTVCQADDLHRLACLAQANIHLLGSTSCERSRNSAGRRLTCPRSVLAKCQSRNKLVGSCWSLDPEHVPKGTCVTGSMPRMEETLGSVAL